MLATGLGYLASGLFLLRIKAVEPEPEPHDGTRLRTQIAEGLRFVFRDPTLRPITLCTATANLGNTILMSMLILFLTRDLGLGSAAVGALMTTMGIGGVLGALTANWWTRRIGQARSIWLVPLLTWPFEALVPLAAPGWRVVFVGVGLAMMSVGVIVYNVAQVSYRQAICPNRLLGRMNATVRLVVWGTMPIGGLIGGGLGEWLGVRGTLWVGAAALVLPMAFLLFSPLRKMRDVPKQAAYS